MSQLTSEDRRIIRNPDLEYAWVEIRMNCEETTFAVNVNTGPLNLAGLKRLSVLINGVLDMELERLSLLQESEVPA